MLNASECSSTINNWRESILSGRSLINAQFHASLAKKKVSICFHLIIERAHTRVQKNSLIVELPRPLEEIHTIIQIAKITTHNASHDENDDGGCVRQTKFFSESGLLLIEFSVTLTSYFSTFDSFLLFIGDHQLAPS